MKNNYIDMKLQSKQDIQDLVIKMCEPLKEFFSEGSAFLNFGSLLAPGPEVPIKLEKFARPLWGLAPLTAGGKEYDIWDNYLEGIKNGTNPKHEEYWGDTEDYDQRMVEMAEIALTLILVPDKIWEPLNDEEKNNLVRWLDKINHRKISESNWRFFNVMVNISLFSLKREYNKEVMEQMLKSLDSYYIDNGWYSDGFSDRIDYYIPMAFHYCSLIYSKVMEKEDPIRSKMYKDRAVEFAKEFIYWFSEDGSAIPFGRSLTYRFAQGAFWGALAFADVEVFSWGVIKGIYFRHLRWWFEKPIFDNAGILSIGYAYENLTMSENYNAPGSPNWAMKIFLPLALDEKHPFWQADEEELPKLSDLMVEQGPRMVMCRNKNHVVGFTAGQSWDHNYAKYCKFAYSNIFGFNVSKGSCGLSLGAYDSVLAISERDGYYRVRGKCEKYSISGEFIYSKWKAWDNVEVENWIIPGNPWHIRIHKIKTKRNLRVADGGFAIMKDKNKFHNKYDEDTIVSQNGILMSYPWGSSGVVNIYGEHKPEIIFAEPNTNLLHQQTYIPTLIGDLEIGCSVFINAVYGNVTQDIVEWENKPEIEFNNNIVRAKMPSGYVVINLDN